MKFSYPSFPLMNRSWATRYSFAFLFVVLACTLSNPMGAQANTKRAIAKLKGTKVILGLTGDAQVDNALRTAVDSFWTILPIIEELPRKEALKKAKKDDRLVVLTFGNVKIASSRPLSSGIKPGGQFLGSTIRYVTSVSSFSALGISKGGIFSYGSGLLAHTTIPREINNSTPDAAIHSAVGYLHNQVKTTLRAKSNAVFFAAAKKRTRRLKSKTLYILEDLFTKKVSPEDFAKIYEYKVEVVDFETWSDVVLSHREGAAYTTVMKIAMAGNNIFMHVIMDPQDGQPLAFVYENVAFSLGPIKLTKGQSPVMNKKMAKLYGNLFKK